MRDIVNTLRALASGLVPAVEEKAMRDAANEIERLELENINLTAERDEARRRLAERAMDDLARLDSETRLMP